MEGPDGRPARSSPRRITEGDGEQLEGPGRRPGAPVDRQRLLPGRGVQHLRREASAELLTVNDELPAVPGRHHATPRSARGSRSPPRPRRRSASRQLPARHRQQGHRPGLIDLVSEDAGQAGGRGVAGARLDAQAEVQEGRHHGLRLRRACPSRPTTCAGVQLIKGTGPRVEKGQTIAVRYLGQVFGGDKPFDENFGDRHGRRRRSAIGTGAVIKGWDQGLVGVTGRHPGGARDPAGARLRRGGQPRQRHPEERRHLVLRHRHPRRGLVMAGHPPRGWQDRGMTAGKSERLLNLLIMLLVQRHYVAKERIREILYPDSTAGRLREDVRARQGRAAQPRACRSRSARWTPTSTTSRATGSGPTSSRCPTSA